MKKSLTLALIFFMFFANSQKIENDQEAKQYKTQNCISTFKKVKLTEPCNAEVLTKFLGQHIRNLASNNVQLKLNYVNESPGGFHYSFTQTYKGIPVYQSEVKVMVDRQNTIHSIFDNTENFSNVNIDVSKTTALSVIAINSENKQVEVVEKTIEKNGIETLKLKGEILFQYDRKSYAAAPDSLVTGKVFNPDPLTTSTQVYAAPFLDNNDSTNVSFNAQMQTVTFTANFTDSIFKLESAYVRIKEFDPPIIAPVTSTTPVFNFNRSQSGFEDVNAFFHISTMRNYINSLGFNCANLQVDIDTHGAGGDDNSYFSPASNPQQITFGTGGVDDAEDADVCVHEYGHFVSETASPSSNFGSERSALDEAFGDYLAASYSKNISNYKSEWMFNWDGHNEFWLGRILNTTRKYPADLQSSKYKNGEMWSAALMDIYDEIGRGATDSLILQAHYSFAMNMSMADAAILLIDADTLLTNGAYYCPIYRHLSARGFIAVNPTTTCATVGVEVVNKLAIDFKQDGFSFTVNNVAQNNLKYKLLDISGREIADFENNLTQFNYSNSLLSAGTYLVMIKANEQTQIFKWCKLN